MLPDTCHLIGEEAVDGISRRAVPAIPPEQFRSAGALWRMNACSPPWRTGANALAVRSGACKLDFDEVPLTGPVRGTLNDRELERPGTAAGPSFG